MPIKLYMVPPSPAVRAVQMTAKALGIELKLHTLDMLKGEHKKEDFLKINPTHTVPTMEDNGFVLWDSHAIMGYLVDKYGKIDDLYPKDVQKRAAVNQMLFFDSSLLFARGVQITAPIIFGNTKTVPQNKKNDLMEVIEMFEKIMKTREYAANDLSIADFSLVTTLTSCGVLMPLEDSKYPNLAKWVERMQKLPYYDVNQKGLDLFKQLLKFRMS